MTSYGPARVQLVMGWAAGHGVAGPLCLPGPAGRRWASAVDSVGVAQPAETMLAATGPVGGLGQAM